MAIVTPNGVRVQWGFWNYRRLIYNFRNSFKPSDLKKKKKVHAIQNYTHLAKFAEH